MLRILLAGAATALALAACATPQTQSPEANTSAAGAERQKQQEILLKANVEAARRLAQVSDGMLIRGANLCEKTAPRVGLRIWSAQAGDGKMAEALRGAYGLTDDVTVFAVGRDTPAARGGLRADDQILSISGWPVPSGPTALKDTEAKLKAELGSRRPIEIRYRRAGKDMRAMIAPATACAYAVVLSDSTSVNAYADGERVVVARGIVDALQKEEELAFVIGHELGHNIMGHIDARKQNAIVAGAGGFVVDIAFAVLGVNTGGAFTKLAVQGGSQAFSVGFEREADYVGLYLVAVSGYNFAEAPSVWRRMAVLNPSSIDYGKSHPTAPERFVALEATVKEIQEKQARREALRPNMKPKPKPIPDSDRVAR